MRAVELVVEAGRLDQLQHRQARRHRDRIAAQRAGLVDRAGRRDLLHDLAASAVRADRHAAADDLAERGQVRRDAVQRLRAAERDAEAGHHFVEDQQRAVLRAQLAQALQIAVARRDAIHVAGDRLDDQRRRSRRRASANKSLRGVEIVVRQGQREIGERLRHARRSRHAERQRAGAGLDQERIAVAVIAAFELDDARAAGGAAREADRRHRRLGAGVDHAHHLDRRHQARDRFGHRHFGRARRAERQAVAHRALDRGAHAPDGCGRRSSAPTSRRSRCSACRRHPTGTRRRRAAVKNGSPPTDLNARTGELTPPGISCRARWKSSWLVMANLAQGKGR